ncbi:MAG: methyltransferase domain-containing protein [Terracidiphilus sp.]
MAKTRPGAGAGSAAAASKPGPTPVADSSANTRISNSLKEFLWLLSDIPHARILDLGSISQSTLNFFLEKGFRLSTEDLLRTWKDCLSTEEERLRMAPAASDGKQVSQDMVVEKFLEIAMGYPEGNFNGVLAWDLLDYFDVAIVPKLMDRLYDIMAPGGAMLALFHSKPAERFHRFRVIDMQKFEAVPAPTLAVHAHVFQNRDILDLFSKFRSSKTFVGRDQVREALFLK